MTRRAPSSPAQIIAETLASARDYGSGVISTAVVDTIKRIHPDGHVTTPPRAELRAVQTPQTFRYAALMEAHRRAAEEDFPATDDAMLYEHYYNEIRLVTAQGTAENIKLTHKSDFDRFAPAFLVGQGYDAHRLKEGRKLILCGVDVPHTRGLDGHSDADVAVHALMDALLGALGEGDIGRHFPDNDDAFKGISSMVLLERVMDIVRERGMRVGNADVTIVAQKPKLSAYLHEMQENLCRALSTECVNVKATTTERMGFEGEETGISAQAVVLLTR
jgi:2-C-methyl-D-erythritol 2,4-cyclodiphosphate synthase